MNVRRHSAAAGMLALLSGLLPAGVAPEGGNASRPATMPADPSLSLQRRICFPQAGPAEVKTFRAPGVVLWTDAPVDGRKILAHLQAVERYLQVRLPPPRPGGQAASRPARRAAAPSRRRPAAVAIYAKAADYRALWRRVGAHYRGSFGRVVTEGHSYRCFCATSYDDPGRFARRRSIICHELAHVWLYQNHALANDGNWLTEGIATAVQLHFFPESGSRRDFARWMKTGRMLPLKRLMDLPRIAPKDYWQAGTLVELLMDRYAEKFPAVLAAFNAKASAFAIVTKTLGADLTTLTEEWADSVRSAASATTRPHKVSPGRS